MLNSIKGIVSSTVIGTVGGIISSSYFAYNPGLIGTTVFFISSLVTDRLFKNTNPVEQSKPITDLAKAIKDAQSISDLKPIIDKIKLKQPTFFGYSSIYVDECPDLLPIDALAQRVIQLVNDCQFEFSKKERANGQKITDRITQIYKENDKLAQQANFITRFFIFVRNIPNIISGIIHLDGHTETLTRKDWFARGWFEDGYRHIFDYYTKEEFIQKAKKEPHESDAFEFPEYSRLGQKAKIYRHIVTMQPSNINSQRLLPFCWTRRFLFVL